MHISQALIYNYLNNIVKSSLTFTRLDELRFFMVVGSAEMLSNKYCGLTKEF